MLDQGISGPRVGLARSDDVQNRNEKVHQRDDDCKVEQRSFYATASRVNAGIAAPEEAAQA